MWTNKNSVHSAVIFKKKNMFILSEFYNRDVSLISAQMKGKLRNSKSIDVEKKRFDCNITVSVLSLSRHASGGQHEKYFYGGFSQNYKLWGLKEVIQQKKKMERHDTYLYILITGCVVVVIIY